MPEPHAFADADAAARAIVDKVGPEIRLALPLGLGKPVTLLNALTRLAAADPGIRLSIHTALTLERPDPQSEMERKFLNPALDRLFGRYPQIEYARMLRDGTLPPNIEVSEFFLMAGRWLDVPAMQESYVSVNYTQALDLVLSRRPNLVLQLLATDGDRMSLSCNTDVTSDLLRLRREGQADFLMAAETNSELPFMPGPAEIAPAEVTLRLDPPGSYELFSVVKRPVAPAEHAIGLHVSRLVRDGGTLQIGIGATGDAVAHALRLRHRGEAAEIWPTCPFILGAFTESGPFDGGLYAVTEMLVDAMLPLLEDGILSRQVSGSVVHAGFFIGCRDFYARLRAMPEDQRARIAMVPVGFTNALHGDEDGKRAARTEARFVNTTMAVTLLGAAASDLLPDGRVVSGIGGQADFVAQALALKGARSILTLRATRHGKSGLVSNVVWSHPHVSVPRHMRDIVVTEYGIADLRGRSDADCISAMLAIADSRFQDELAAQARDAGKLPQDYRIPEAHRDNLPETVSAWLDPFRDRLPVFPFGTDFTEVEQRLLPALSTLRRASRSRRGLARLAWKGRSRGNADEAECLERMGFAAPRTISDRMKAAALRGALRSSPH